MDELLTGAGNWLPFVALFIPLIVGLITKLNASSGVKSVSMIVVTGLASLAQQVDVGGGILTKEMASAWIMTMIISVATYYGVWKPLDVPSKLGPDVGIG